MSMTILCMKLMQWHLVLTCIIIRIVCVCLDHIYFTGLFMFMPILYKMASKSPTVVKFRYHDFEIISDRKWCAKCKQCGEKITETRGTSSSFTKHMEQKHAAMFEDYKKRKSN